MTSPADAPRIVPQNMRSWEFGGVQQHLTVGDMHLPSWQETCSLSRESNAG